MCAAERLIYIHLSHLHQLCWDQWRHRRNIFIPEHGKLTDNNFEKLMNIKCNAHLLNQGIKFKQSLTSKYKQQVTRVIIVIMGSQ